MEKGQTKLIDAVMQVLVVRGPTAQGLRGFIACAAHLISKGSAESLLLLVPGGKDLLAAAGDALKLCVADHHQALAAKHAQQLVAQIARQRLDQLGGAGDRVSGGAHFLQVGKDVDDGNANGFRVGGGEEARQREVAHELVVVVDSFDGLCETSVRVKAGKVNNLVR